jgi:hypothetical protein
VTAQRRATCRIGRGRPLARLFVALAAIVVAAACNRDEHGGDCIAQGLARMGREGLSSLEVTCELPFESWIVAFPRDVTAHDIPQLPQKYRTVIDSSAAEGYTWCVSAERQESTPADIAMACARLAVEVRTAAAVRGSRFAAQLRLRPDGKGVLDALTVRGR